MGSGLTRRQFLAGAGLTAGLFLGAGAGRYGIARSLKMLPSIGADSFGMSYETEFQRRAVFLTDQVADRFEPPCFNVPDPLSRTGNGCPDDLEKYYWPKTIARFHKYGINDPAGNHWIEYFRHHPTYHFLFLGMARIMPLYAEAPAMQAYKDDYLANAFDRTDSYNAWTGEGTENQVVMDRTSGYIYATQALGNRELPSAARRRKQMRDWIAYWSRRVYEVGNGEWNTSVYDVYGVASLLNLYDFAPNHQVREMARAVLDYYAATVALYYTQGITGGAEMRGNTSYTSTSNGTDYLNWLWFGDTARPLDTFWSGNEYIQSMHAVTSSYRPPEIAVKLARKQLVSPSTYHSSYPSYLLHYPSESKQIFYVGKRYTLGTAFVPYGGWASGNYGVVNWKLVARTESGPTAHTVWGNGGYHSATQARSRNPWDQFIQHHNVLIQTTRVPSNAEELISHAGQMIAYWQQRWQRDFSRRFPDDKKPNPVHPYFGDLESALSSYIFYPADSSTTTNNNILFVDVEGTYLAIRSLQLPSPVLSRAGIVRDRGQRDAVSGLVMEVGDSSMHGSFESFQDKITSSTYLDRSRLESEMRVSYRSLSGEVIEAQYQTKGSYREPIFDWGYGPTKPLVIPTSPPFEEPDWPSGEGAGRLAEWRVNGKLVDLSKVWPVYSGPNLVLNNSVLTLSDGENTYTVDYSSKYPRFSLVTAGSCRGIENVAAVVENPKDHPREVRMQGKERTNYLNEGRNDNA